MSFFLTSCFFSSCTSFFRRCCRLHRTISLSSLVSHELILPSFSSHLLPWSPLLQSSLRFSHRICSLHHRHHRALSAVTLVAFAPLVNFSFYLLVAVDADWACCRFIN
ncbi:hypothetical protein Ahy_A07g036575 isoform A [Arachis hypogaea]|uniref:Uncharacterized protein n=1 Tax=Arachis hypogaea TaxID=3818 RepID=A0A445CGI5_ARAHY|nr:hypothetical protein Ahy_A07g036575 isoform A [Arachis hypogaea]